MKKVFMLFAACAVVAGMAMTVSCSKDSKDKDDTDLIDDDDDPEDPTNKPGEQTSTFACLNGSEYYPIIMDGTTSEKLGSKIVCDLRPDDVNKFLYVWEGTYTGNTASGLNFFGIAGDYTSLAVTNVGWSGAGYFVTGKVDGFDKIANLNNPGYYFHIAYKGAANVAHACYFAWGDGNLYRFVLGQGQTEVEGVMTQALKPINNDGAFVANEWNEYEISLADAGVDFTHALSANADGVPGTNVFCFLSGGTSGTVINLDAAFFYKK